MKKQVKALAMKLFEITQRQFPEIHFINIQEHPEQVGRYWINVRGDMSEDRELQMDEFVAEQAMDILVEHGYSFAIMVDNSLLEAAQ
jgi:hypothetical protein